MRGMCNEMEAKVIYDIAELKLILDECTVVEDTYHEPTWFKMGWFQEVTRGAPHLSSQ